MLDKTRQNMIKTLQRIKTCFKIHKYTIPISYWTQLDSMDKAQRLVKRS